MDGACGTCGRKNVLIVLVGSLRERDTEEDLGIDGKIVLRYMLQK